MRYPFLLRYGVGGRCRPAVALIIASSTTRVLSTEGGSANRLGFARSSKNAIHSVSSGEDISRSINPTGIPSRSANSK